MAELATLARPYAKAIYSLAQKQGKQSDWLRELGVLSAVVAEPKVVSVLFAQKMSKDQQVNFLLGILETEQLDSLMQNFVTVLSENGRLSVLPEIFEQYRELALSGGRTQEALIYSAYPLEGKELDELVITLEKKLNTKLQVSVEINPKLIGGIKVEFGDQVLDMSVQQQLNALYSAMIN